MHKKEVIFLKNFSLLLLGILPLYVLSCISNELLHVQINDLKLQVEVADDVKERERGMMFRETLASDRGMLFVFDEEQRHVFWMKNTSIPLSIAFINSEGIITEIYDMVPYSTDPVASRYPARYALEVVVGTFSKHGVRIGDRMQFSLLKE